MDARRILLLDHTRIHAARTSSEADLAAAGGFTMQDACLRGLEEAHLRAVPGPGLMSIVWHAWHLTRIEDLIVNTGLRGMSEILDRGDWLARLKVDERLVGTGDTDDEVRAFGERVDVTALFDYRDAVGRETRAWIADLDLAALEEPPDLTVRLAAAPAWVRERGAWLGRFYAGKSGLFLLTFPVANHAFMHWGQALVTRAALGFRNP
ncbi:MAG: DinB family protein [Chloroflexi bacterium]|nr:DinB family protein [Chloroflexota bacterium]